METLHLRLAHSRSIPIPAASDDLDQGHRTQVWLAVSDDPAAKVTGEYFYHMRPRTPKEATREVELQDKLLDVCRKISGVELPR
jgi:hypothetical protein